MTTTTDVNSRSLRVLFLVEGYTDIRYVDGLARICDLTMAIPVRTYESSGLKQRLADCGSPVAVHEIPGGRLALAPEERSCISASLPWSGPSSGSSNQDRCPTARFIVDPLMANANQSCNPDVPDRPASYHGLQRLATRMIVWMPESR